MTMGLTQRQADVFSYLKKRKAVGQVMPTVLEIAYAVGLKSRSRAHAILDGLEERGFIRRQRNLARAIEILDQSFCCPNCGHRDGPLVSSGVSNTQTRTAVHGGSLP